MLFRVTAHALIVMMLLQSVAFAQVRPSSREKAAAAEDADQQTIVMPPEEEQQPPVGLDGPIDPDTYIIGPYDEFLLFMRGRDKEIRLVVLPEGSVMLPNVGTLRAAGLTITQFREALRKALTKFYRNADFDCELSRPRTFVAHVSGEVEAPGEVLMTAPFRIDAAIARAGGFTPRASRRAIEIRAGDEVLKTVDLKRYRRLGTLQDNPQLMEGQTVYVPPQGDAVILLGEVWRPGPYEILEGETIASALELAGGPTPNADRHRLVLERIGEDQSVTVMDLTRDEAENTELQGLDVVVVPDRRSFPGTDYVRIDGGGGRVGRVPLQPGETLESFIPRFIRLERDHDLEHSVIERQAPDGSVDFIPVDIDAVIAGKAEPIVLQSGDVISIPERTDVVYVTGQVVRPGEVDFQRGLPAGRYIALAGGTSSAGSMDKIEIYSVNGERRGGNRDSVVYRGETIIVKRRTSVILGGIFLGLTSLTSLALSIIAVSRTN